MASLTRDGVSLDISDHLEWVDEFTYSPVEQTQEYLSEGALVVQEGVKQAGRPITLKSGEGVYPLNREITPIFDEVQQSAGKTYQLTLADGRTFDVMFNHANTAFEAPIDKFWRASLPDPDQTRHSLTLRFITV